MKNSIIFCALFIISFSAKTQTREISGVVYAFNKFPLKNVNVSAKKSKMQVVTDDNGRFIINVKKNDNLTIEATAFDRYTCHIKEKDTNLRINLIYENNERYKEIAIDEGIISREDLEYGLEHLASDNNIYYNFTDVFDAIHYALPAANFIVENGTKKVMLRGPKTVAGSNAALFVVDGVIVDDISYVAPSEIVDIKQLSSSQAAIYGARGGGGVVVITTK